MSKLKYTYEVQSKIEQIKKSFNLKDENIIIVDTDDSVLVCSKNNTQDIKKIIEYLKGNSRTELI